MSPRTAEAAAQAEPAQADPARAGPPAAEVAASLGTAEELPSPLISIGEAAELIGTTTRTLRYYEQLGLVRPTRQSSTAQRRYGADELDRLRQIRELQTLLGLDLDEIGEHLAAWDHLEELKAEYQSEPPPARRRAILAEGLPILESLRRRVDDRQEQLAAFASHLDDRMRRYHEAMGSTRPRD
jgi:DNA-binding transcriptional MerR regulator